MWVPTDDFAQLQLQFVDQTQWRYEVIRPIVLFADRTPRQRADETDTHPATVRTLTRRFRQQGMVGLLPEDVEVTVRARVPRVPEVVRQEIDRLKALYLTFRTLFRSSEAIMAAPPEKRGGRALHGSLHML